MALCGYNITTYWKYLTRNSNLCIYQKSILKRFFSHFIFEIIIKILFYEWKVWILKRKKMRKFFHEWRNESYNMSKTIWNLLVQTIWYSDMPTPCVFVFLEQIEHLIVLSHILLWKKRQITWIEITPSMRLVMMWVWIM